jgi:L-lactate dehydrogenase complex protein LldG
MLQRIREAAAAGNRAGSTPALPDRGTVGYQGAGADPVACFRQAFVAAGGQLHVVADRAAAVTLVVDLVRQHSARRVLLGRGHVLRALPLAGALADAMVEVLDGGDASLGCDAVFQADLGVSGVDYLIAETGSVVLASRPEQPRWLSLLPPVHVAVAEPRQILPDLFDLFSACGARGEELPSGLTIITGPSKTGDIELRLVTGVHGPGAVHVVLMDPQAGVS